MRTVLASLVILGVTLGLSSGALALTEKGVQRAWGKALRTSAVATASGIRLSKLGLSPAARATVKATIKQRRFFGPTDKTTLTLPGKGAVASQTFAVRVLAPGYDTGSSDFVAQQVTTVFSRSTGAPLATHQLKWSGEEILANGWRK